MNSAVINHSIVMFMAYLTLYHFVYFLFNRKEKSYLFFSFLLFSLSFYTFLGVYNIDSKFTRTLFSLFFGLSCAYSLVLFLNSSFGYNWRKYYKGILLISTITAISTLFIIIHDYSIYLKIFILVAIIQGSVILAILILYTIFFFRQRLFYDKAKLSILLGLSAIGLSFFIGYYLKGSSYKISYIGLAISCMFISISMLLKHLNQYKETVDIKNNLDYIVKEQTAKLRDTNKQLALEKEYKANLLVNAAHELKTPHTVLKSSLYRLGELYPEVQKSEQFKVVEHEMDNIVSDAINILDETRFDGQEVIYEHNMVYSLSEQLRHKVKLFKEYAGDRGIDFEANIPGGINIKASDDAVNRVINNVFENAVKFSSVKGRVEVILKRGEEFNALSIRDNGSGIPEDELKHIFEKNYQITRDKQVSKGIGLGLYLTNKIVREIGGKVEVDSINGEGTVVKLLFPVCKEKVGEKKEYIIELPKRRTKVEVEVGDSEQREGLSTILIVEDEPRLLKSLKEALEEDYNIITASNGEKALERLDNHNPDLILTDIMMPLMNGIELCKKVSALDSHSHIPFIFLTAKSTDKALFEGFEAGAIDYITKPFDLNLVKIRVTNNIRVMKLMKENVKLNIEMYRNLDRGEKYKKYNLTKRRQDYIELLIKKGEDYKSIAEILDVSENAVRSNLHYIRKQVGCLNNRDLIDYFK